MVNIGDKISMPYDGRVLPGIIRGFRTTRYNGEQAIVDITYPDDAIVRRHFYVGWLEKWAAAQPPPEADGGGGTAQDK